MSMYINPKPASDCRDQFNYDARYPCMSNAIFLNDDGPFLFISPLPFLFLEHITSNVFYMYSFSHILPCFEKLNCCRIRSAQAEIKSELPVKIRVS